MHDTPPDEQNAPFLGLVAQCTCDDSRVRIQGWRRGGGVLTYIVGCAGCPRRTEPQDHPLDAIRAWNDSFA